MGDIQPWEAGLCPTFPKIYSPFKRATEGPNKNKLKEGDWYAPSFATLQHATWRWTEKLDGTNIRIHWSGFRRYVGGRTDRAELPRDLVSWIDENLPEELFEQMFQDKPVTLYGEGIGAGIQKVGGNYSPTKKFVLFDVLIDGVWHTGETITEVAEAFGIEQAREYLCDNVWNAIDLVSDGMISSYSTDGNTFWAEGLVGVPVDGFRDFRGGRIMLKVKHEDFYVKGMIPYGG